MKDLNTTTNYTNVQYVIAILRDELSHVNSDILWYIFLQITATVTAPEDKEQICYGDTAIYVLLHGYMYMHIWRLDYPV